MKQTHTHGTEFKVRYINQVTKVNTLLRGKIRKNNEVAKFITHAKIPINSVNNYFSSRVTVFICIYVDRQTDR